MAVLVASTITPVTEIKVSSSPTTDQWPLWKAKAPSPPPYHHGEDKQRTRASPPHKVFLLLVFNHIFFQVRFQPKEIKKISDMNSKSLPKIGFMNNFLPLVGTFYLIFLYSTKEPNVLGPNHEVNLQMW